ncbi:unnamed protein product [Prunus armeniaca]
MNTILIKGWVSGDWVPTKNSLWLDCDCATAGHQQSEAPGKLQECRNNVIQSVLQSCGALQQLRELQYPKCGIFCCSVEQRSSLLISAAPFFPSLEGEQLILSCGENLLPCGNMPPAPTRHS